MMGLLSVCGVLISETAAHLFLFLEHASDFHSLFASIFLLKNRYVVVVNIHFATRTRILFRRCPVVKSRVRQYCSRYSSRHLEPHSISVHSQHITVISILTMPNGPIGNLATFTLSNSPTKCNSTTQITKWSAKQSATAYSVSAINFFTHRDTLPNRGPARLQ